MTAGDFHDLVSDCLKQSCMLVMPAKTRGPSSPAHQQLEALTKKVFGVWLHIRLLMPDVSRPLRAFACVHGSVCACMHACVQLMTAMKCCMHRPHGVQDSTC